MEEQIFTIVNNFLTITGLFSVIVTFIRAIYNSRKKTWRSDFSIKDYPGNYDAEQYEKNAIYSSISGTEDEPYLTTIVFKPINCMIPKVHVYELDTNGRTIRKIESFRNLSPDDALCFRIERAEIIPRYKIRWYSITGDYAESYFNDNLRNGINDESGCVYHQTFRSFIRKAFGFIY